MIKLLLIDHQPVVREGFRRYLDQDNGRFVLTAEADSGREGYLAFIRSRPDIVVMELSLPDIDGLEVARKILQHNPSAKILAFNAQDNDLLLRRARDLGIKGFINKRSGGKRIMDALNEIVAGGSYFREITSAKVNPLLGWGIDLLTPREFEVFRHLAEGHSVSSIAQLLDSCSKTVGVHQTRIMKKLGVSNSAQLAHLALSSGIINLQPVPLYSQAKAGPLYEDPELISDEFRNPRRRNRKLAHNNHEVGDIGQGQPRREALPVAV